MGSGIDLSLPKKLNDSMDNLDRVIKLHVYEGRYEQERRKSLNMRLRLISFGLLALLLVAIVSLNIGAQLAIIDSQTYPETFRK